MFNSVIVFEQEKQGHFTLQEDPFQAKVEVGEEEDAQEETQEALHEGKGQIA